MKAKLVFGTVNGLQLHVPSRWLVNITIGNLAQNIGASKTNLECFSCFCRIMLMVRKQFHTSQKLSAGMMMVEGWVGYYEVYGFEDFECTASNYS